MALNEMIQDDLKTALKAKDAVRLSTLRMLRSELKNREIEVRHTLDDAEVQQVIRGMLKQRRESLEAYEQAGRQELAAQERAEVEILQGYLPPELRDDELAALIDEVLAGLPEGAPRQPGPVTGQVMQRVAGRADGKRVSAMVRQRLEG